MNIVWRFKFNYDKCAVLIFKNKTRSDIVYGKCIKECQYLINEVLLYKYLGVELDYVHRRTIEFLQ